LLGATDNYVCARTLRGFITPKCIRAAFANDPLFSAAMGQAAPYELANFPLAATLKD